MYLRHDDKDDRDDRSEAKGCGERLRESALPNARRLFFLALVKVVQREDALLRWLGLLRRCLGRGPERHAEIERASERADWTCCFTSHARQAVFRCSQRLSARPSPVLNVRDEASGEKKVFKDPNQNERTSGCLLESGFVRTTHAGYRDRHG